MLAGNAKWGAFRAANAFCLPSHQENFGIVVAEAMACGCPVLISNQVNIWDEIHANGAGFVEPDTIEGVQNLLRRWRENPVSARQAIGEKALACQKERFGIQSVNQKLQRLIQRQLDMSGAQSL